MDRLKEVKMKIILKSAAIALFLVFVFMQISFADANTDALDRARSLVEQKSYKEAIGLYNGISAWLRRDPGLVIEFARVYTYADRHKEAIALFEEVRKQYPDKEKEILRELADQYKWDGQLKKSIEIYRRAKGLGISDIQAELGLAQALAWDNQHKESLKEYDEILKNAPDSIETLLGKAEVLSWDDKLERAEALYDEVLKREPQNFQAENGVARVHVWQGYHREGVRLYEAIIKDHPLDPDALEGLAFAYHWDGQETLALKTLEELLAKYPQRNAARDLFDEIKNARKLQVGQFNRYSHDSNHLSILSDRLRAVQNIDDFSVAGASYNWFLFRQPGKTPINANRWGLDFNRRLSQYFEVNSYLYVTDYSTSFTPITSNTWFTVKPDDIWRFDFAYDRETFEDIDSILNKIVVNSGSFSFDWRPDRFWLFSAKYKRGHYTDGNNQDTVFSRLEYRIQQKPFIKLYYNYYYSGWSAQKDHGYFNPKSVQSHTLGIYASKDLTKKLFVEGQASSGYEWQNPKENHPTYYGALGVNYRLTSNWLLNLRGEYFNALDTNPKKGYSKKTAFLTLSYSFGAEPTRSFQGSQPQRPTGQ